MTIPGIQKQIRDSGLQPSRAAGQHFLLDESVVERMCDAAKITAKDTVLEIGPGFGILTNALVARGAKVISIELDQRLAAYMRRTMSAATNLTVVEGDVFRVRLDEYVKDFGYKLVANLPYSSTSLIFRQFLTRAPRPTEMCVLIQREVAERITAPAGQHSLLSLSVQYYGQPSVLFEVPNTDFYPAPEVTSAVLQVKKIADKSPELAKKMFRLAKMGFAGKRKQLKKSLAAGLHEEMANVSQVMLECGIAPEIRPQELEINSWLTLAEKLG